jgi:zinc protease
MHFETGIPMQHSRWPAVSGLLLACAATLGCVLVSAVARATPASVAGFSYVKSLAGVDEYTLDANGLQVLVKPDHSAPVVTFQVTYRVGSRNEVTGTTGATHILEHLMFKGSDHFNDPAGNSIKQYLEAVGAGFNANTSFDRTTYFGTLGTEHLEGYIAIEADRMRHLWLHEADRQAEMTVVRNEFERGENNPESALLKEVQAMVFMAHPYHHDTIGWRSDIEHVPIEKLRAFYDTFYWPDNATVSVIGDIDAAQALGLVNKYYGRISRAPEPIPVVYTEEPPQSGPRRVSVSRPGQLGTVIVAYKIPAARHADLPAIEVLGSILSDGKSSRLYPALVDKSLALATEAGAYRLHDPGMFIASVQLAPGATHDEVEKILLAQIEKVKTAGVTAGEVGNVVRQYQAAQAYERDGTANVASVMNEWIAAGDWTLYARYADEMAKVTPADVQRVAKTYLGHEQSTTGWFVPVVAK